MLENNDPPPVIKLNQPEAPKIEPVPIPKDETYLLFFANGASIGGHPVDKREPIGSMTLSRGITPVYLADMIGRGVIPVTEAEGLARIRELEAERKLQSDVQAALNPPDQPEV